MSGFMSDPAAKRQRATKEQLSRREKEAMHLLSEGMGKAAVARHLASKHELCLRQARRYTNTAALELMCEPLQVNNLDAGIALDLDRLDLLVESAMDDKDFKTAIQATKAHAMLSIQRLKSLEASINTARRVMPF